MTKEEAKQIIASSRLDSTERPTLCEQAAYVLADALEASERRVKELEAIARDLLDYGEFYTSAIEVCSHIEGKDGESFRKRLEAALAAQPKEHTDAN